MQRRSFINGSLSALACAAMPALASTQLSASQHPRKLLLSNPYTGEKLDAVFWENGSYVEENLAQFNYLLRDYHLDESTHMDPRLLQALFYLQERLGGNKEIQVVSAYRTELTNDFLREQGFNVASNSLHGKGKALDIVMPGHSLKELNNTARKIRCGGVGYYPNNGFVHLDTGRIRYW